jgi:hypothetical protein
MPHRDTLRAAFFRANSIFLPQKGQFDSESAGRQMTKVGLGLVNAQENGRKCSIH